MISNMASTKQRELEKSKQYRKGATRIKISSLEKWMHSLTTLPVPCSEIPFASGKSTNFSFIVLGSLKKGDSKEKRHYDLLRVDLLSMIKLKWFTSVL